jgi:hypothetical protein
MQTTTKCPKCGGAEIARGRISMSTGHYLWGMVFEPEGRRFLTLSTMSGTFLNPDSYACLGCGVVWSQTDPKALKDFIGKHCKKPEPPKN